MRLTLLFLPKTGTYWRYRCAFCCASVFRSFSFGGEMALHVEWEQLYQEALLELDDAVLVDRISSAELAVRKRLADMRIDGKPGAGHQHEERHRLEDALVSLQCLRRISAERLK